MESFSLIMRVITTLLSIYSFIVFIRILLTWIPIPQLDRVKNLLGTVVDPYLNQFRNITWLRWGMFDFSPVIGLVLLSVVIRITGTLANQSAITVGQVSIILISAIWGFISFIMNALIILLIVRLVVSMSNGGGASSWGNIDSMIYNLMARVVGLFTRKSVSFHTGLLITMGFLFVLRIGLGFLVNFLAALLINL